MTPASASLWRLYEQPRSSIYARNKHSLFLTTLIHPIISANTTQHNFSLYYFLFLFIFSFLSLLLVVFSLINLHFLSKKYPLRLHFLSIYALVLVTNKTCFNTSLWPHQISLLSKCVYIDFLFLCKTGFITTMLQDVIQPPTPDEQHLPIVITSSFLYLVLMHVLLNCFPLVFCDCVWITNTSFFTKWLVFSVKVYTFGGKRQRKIDPRKIKQNKV